MTVDKQNGNVVFNEEYHKYWNTEDNGHYISVTTLIEQFGQPFEKDFWSKYKAFQSLVQKDEFDLEKKALQATHKFNDELLKIYNIDEDTFLKQQQKILDEWEATNKEACERGTKIHSELEHSMYDMGDNVNLQRFGIGGKFVCDKGRTELDLENGVYPEYLISRTSADKVLRLAGQIDLLVKRGNKITVGDFKTNKKIDLHSYFDPKIRSTTKMKYPLNNLEDCNFYHYTLQLSTYAWMIQQLNPAYEIEDLVLIHFDHNKKMTIYHLDYLKDEVEKMLRWHKRQILHQKQLEKYKRIEY